VEVTGVGLVQLPAALVLEPMVVAAGVPVQQIHCTRAPGQPTGRNRPMTAHTVEHLAEVHRRGES
jgi:hypothetical protein